MRHSNVLVTGGLGFVGSELTRDLLRARDVERVVLPIRRLGSQSAAERFQRLVDYWRRFAQAPTEAELRKAVIVECDLEQTLDPAAFGAVDVLYHAAATTELGAPLTEARRANLFLTHRVLGLAAGIRARGGLERFVHFSTAYVCGRRRGTIREDDPPPAAFHNHYERTKREAEEAVRWSGLPHVILRPSIIVGRSDTGYLYRLKVLYSVWRMWLSGHVPRAPIDPKAWVDIVPIDYVVAAARQLAVHPDAAGRCVHLCAGEDRQSPKTIMLCATRVFGVPVPPVSPPWAAHALRAPVVRRFVAHALREILDVMYWHLPYLGIRGRLFDTRTADALVAVRRPEFARYGETLFAYCRDTAWGKRALTGKEVAACSA